MNWLLEFCFTNFAHELGATLYPPWQQYVQQQKNILLPTFVWLVWLNYVLLLLKSMNSTLTF